MLRLIPPAGTPVKLGELLRAGKGLFSANGNSQEVLRSLASRLHVGSAFGVSSGRAALSVILRSLRALQPERNVVAIPAYTCFSVPAAVVRAGLKLHSLEMCPETLDLDPAQLESFPPNRLLAIVTSNLFGLVNDMAPIRQFATASGAFVVDDSAQAFGASWGGRPAGTLGDVGFYSFARGKALAAGEGSVIVTDSEEIADAIRKQIAQLPSHSRLDDGLLLMKVAVSALFLRPRLYWIPDSLPFLKLGATEFSPSFAVRSFPESVRCLLPELLGRLEEWNQKRSTHARILASAIRNKEFLLPRVAPECVPTFVRFPVFAKDEATRNRAVTTLRRAGIGASPFYPGAVCDIVGIEHHFAKPDFHCPQAEAIARRLFTLPTHPLLQPADLQHMAETLTRL